MTAYASKSPWAHEFRPQTVLDLLGHAAQGVRCAAADQGVIRRYRQSPECLFA